MDEGTFAQSASLRQDGTLRACGVQRMKLGTGAQHSEREGSKAEPMRFLQFWILPDTPSLPPSVEQRQFTREDRHGRLLKVIGPEGGDVVAVHQDASAYVAALEPSSEVEYAFGQDRAGLPLPHRGSRAVERGP